MLLVGGVPGLPYVDTSQWGGLMLDVIVCVRRGGGRAAARHPAGARPPLAVAASCGTLSIGFIELWRGVPLLTVLFMSAVMLPLFLPQGVSVDRLIRAMVALTLFNAAYMAEAVRGGLQGVPNGPGGGRLFAWPCAGGRSRPWSSLPQALRIVVPGIVNTVSTCSRTPRLVTIVGLVDLLGVVNQALKDPAWLGLAKEGYVFTAVVFFVCCFAMSRYGRSVERRLNRHRPKASAE